MSKWLIIFILAGACGFLAYKAFNKNDAPSPAPTAQTPVKKDWTPEEIAKDTQGYLVWSQQQINEQIKVRNERLASLSARRADVVARQKALVDKTKAVENFHNRLKSAFRRAQDEDRWPVRMAGTTYERAKAIELIEQTRGWLDDRQSLGDAYVSALAKMDESATTLRNDISKLGQLQQKLALDLERVRLNAGMAELDKLRQTEDQLASMSKSLSQMSEQEAPVLPPGSKSERLDIDAIVK